MRKLLLSIFLCLLAGSAFAECPKNAPNASVSVSSATDTTLVAGQPGKIIYVWEVQLENNHATVDVTVTLKSNATSLHGAGFLLKAPGGSWTKNCAGGTVFSLTMGDPLVLTTSAAGTISGYVKYSIE